MSGRATVFVLIGLALLLVTGACSSDSDDVGTDASVFDVEEGDCVVPPAEVKAELAKITVVPCEEPHTQEAFAVVEVENADAYPGDDALRALADGQCVERYEGYVGKPYPESSLFFTYLLPSPRGWDDAKDRKILCLVTTTGDELTQSVKGSEL